MTSKLKKSASSLGKADLALIHGGGTVVVRYYFISETTGRKWSAGWEITQDETSPWWKIGQKEVQVPDPHGSSPAGGAKR